MKAPVTAHFPKRRKTVSGNLQSRLFNRENGIHRRTNEYTINRKFYQNVFPNLTIVDIVMPACFLRKFTPDGKYIIAFSYQNSLEVYAFNGTSAAAELFRSCDISKDYISSINTKLSYIRESIFRKLFTLKHSIRTFTGLLNRECSLFTKDGRYIIVAAANQISFIQLSASFSYTSNEFISLTSTSNLEEYTFYLIDLEIGKISDSIKFKYDKIILSHNQGIYLYKNTLAILSVFNQTIHIYNICNGRFMQLHKIGRFCSQLENEMYSAVYPTNRFKPIEEVTINSLKHRILVFLYKKASKRRYEENDNHELGNFFKHFDRFKNLKMWKMQLLDDDHLLMKYANVDSTAQLSMVKNVKHKLAFFVFYQISKSKILKIYDSVSAELLHIFENFGDCFRNSHIISDVCRQFPSNSPNNSLYSHHIYQKCKKTMQAARGGGVVEATRRILARFPINAQSYSQSPYLDLDLFIYDDKFLSVLERPKTVGEFPMRFFDRDYGKLKFRIHVGEPQNETLTQSEINDRRLVTFAFHPFEPFAISIQRLNNSYTVNFHIKNENITNIN